MHRDGEICGLIGQDLVDHFNVALGHPIDVNAACCVGPPLFDRAEFTPARVVKLQITAAFGVEREHGVLPGLGDIGKKFVVVALVKINGLIVFFAHAANQVQHRRRRNCELDGRIAGQSLQTIECLQKRMVFRKTDSVGNHDGLGFGLMTFEMHRPGLGFDVTNTAERRQKVQMPVCSAKLAVGDGAQAVFKLLGNELFDFGVFNGREFFLADLTAGEFDAGLRHGFGTQKAADDIAAIRRIDVNHSGNPSRVNIEHSAHILPRKKKACRGNTTNLL